jgi:spermidine synthase
VCEIEPRIPPISARFFAKENYGVFRNPRTHIVYDDARHYLLTTTEKFDIIASDPLDVFVKGTAALYSKEYFEAVKQHLNPGGMFTLYVPLWEADLRTVKSEAATFFDAFPYATAWANTRDGQGYDMVFMGQAEPFKIDLDQIEQRLNQPGYAPVAASLREIGIFSAIDLLSVYTGQKADLGRWVQGAEINRDRDLRLQYLAGWGLNSHLQDTIYRQMLMYRDLSISPFTGSGASVQSLRAAIGVATADPQ